MKHNTFFGLCAIAVVSFIVIFSCKSGSKSKYVQLPENSYFFQTKYFPKDSLSDFQNLTGITSIDSTKGSITLDKKTLFRNTSEIISNVMLEGQDDISIFYNEKSQPRARYWEFVVGALPKFAEYGFKYAPRIKTTDKKKILQSFLLYRLDRSPQNVEKLYNLTKEVLFSKLSKNMYEKLGYKDYVGTLIKAYDHLDAIPNKELKFTAIINAVNKEDQNRNIFGSRTAHQYGHYSSILNQEIVDKYKLGYSPVQFGEYNTAVWFHSFWVRRHKEKNAEVVIKILREIQANYQ